MKHDFAGALGGDPDDVTGPYMVTAKDVRNGHIDYSTARRTSSEAFNTLLTDKSRPRVGDVLLTKDGSIGRVAVCDREDLCINQSVALLQPSEAVVSAYLSYLLQAPEYQALMEADAGGSTIKHIYITRVDKMLIPLPPIAQQRAIAEVLGTLDDKIAANGRLISTLDDLSSLLHRRAAADGVTVPLSSLARFVNGKAFTKGASGTGRVVVRIAELNSGLAGSTVYNDIDVADDHVARPGDLLFAWSGSLTVVRWFRPEAIVNQHIFKVIPAGHPTWLVDQALRTKLAEFKAIAADKATTMGHIQRRHLDEPVALPEKDEVDRMDGLMSGLWSRALAAEQETLHLGRTRDALLPLLVSGKVRVKDVEKLVAGAV